MSDENIEQECPECGALCLVDDGNYVAIESIPVAAPIPSTQAVEDTGEPDNQVQRFQKKPVVISAIRWTGDNLREVITFTDGKTPCVRTMHAGMMWEQYCDLVACDGLKIYTLEGKMLANVGDWIIRGVQGEFYPCKHDIFEQTYAAPTPSPSNVPGAIERDRKIWANGFVAGAKLEAAPTQDADARPVASPDKAFEAWASDPIRADRIPLDRHPNGAYKDTRSYLICYGWKSALATRDAAAQAADDEANARLAAAAPGLLEACQLLVADYEDENSAIGDDWYRKAKAAIAKANGEAQ